MIFRPYLILALLAVAGCASQTAAIDAAATDNEAIAAADMPVPGDVAAVTEAEPEEERVPDACELLLRSLEETRPLLAGLDSSLASQAERVELAIAAMMQPDADSHAADCPSNKATPLGSKEIIGAIEWLYMNPPGRHYRARVDSGAETSSLSASDVVEFERDGDNWVRFTFQHDSSSEPVQIELPVKRTVLVRQASAEDAVRRFVVEIDIRLGEQLQATEFTLTDRSSMTYPVLLGRAFLMDLYVIDVSRSYTHDKYEVGD